MMKCRFLGEKKKGKKKKKEKCHLGRKATPRFETKEVGTNPCFILIFHIILRMSEKNYIVKQKLQIVLEK